MQYNHAFRRLYDRSQLDSVHGKQGRRRLFLYRMAERKKETPYRAEIKYQNGPFFLYVFVSCSNPQNMGGCRALYEDMMKYLNRSARAYDGYQYWEGQTTGWYPAP